MFKEIVDKMTDNMIELGLTEGKDFRVSEGHGQRICVQMNTGLELKSYRNGLEQMLKGTGHTLELSSAPLYVKDRKKSA